MGNKENFTNRMYVDRSSSGASPCVHVTEQHMTGFGVIGLDVMKTVGSSMERAQYKKGGKFTRESLGEDVRTCFKVF